MTFVLIPGAGGSAWSWSRLEPELRRRGHEVVAVDLPGDDDGAGFAEYTDVVVEAIGDRDDLVLVALSLGGFTAPLVCQKVAVSRIVLVNAMIPAPGESAGDWWGNTGQGQAMRETDVRDGRLADAEFDPLVYFLHDMSPDVLNEAGAHVRDQSVTPFGPPWPLPAWPDVPTRVLAGRDDRFFPVRFQQRVALERLGLTAEVIPGGHLGALSHPVELADALETQP